MIGGKFQSKMGKSAAVNVKKGEISNFLTIYLSAGNFIFTDKKMIGGKFQSKMGKSAAVNVCTGPKNDRR